MSGLSAAHRAFASAREDAKATKTRRERPGETRVAHGVACGGETIEGQNEGKSRSDERRKAGTARIAPDFGCWKARSGAASAEPAAAHTQQTRARARRSADADPRLVLAPPAAPPRQSPKRSSHAASGQPKSRHGSRVGSCTWPQCRHFWNLLQQGRHRHVPARPPPSVISSIIMHRELFFAAFRILASRRYERGTSAMLPASPLCIGYLHTCR